MTTPSLGKMWRAVKARPVRISLSLPALCALVLLALGLFAGAGMILRQYPHVAENRDRVKILEKRIGLQQELICVQRAHIQKFARRMNEVNEELTTLYEFEKNIRSVTKMIQPAGKSHNVGGPMPMELSPDLPLTLTHGNLIREMNDTSEELLAAARVQEDSFSSLLKRIDAKRDFLACKPSLMPVDGDFTSGFGFRTSPFTGLREFHRGLDICAPSGTPVTASANGKVTFVGRKMGLGKVIVIDHGYGMVTRYGHLSAFCVKQGDTVERGQIVGRVGNTGRSTGPHLHYEVHINGIPINPAKYITAG
ncbi:MAG: peptidoglycan DD-metalloendopeptidase family protein [Thermodesulfobacteriota bacterium]